jgi:class 3 adenylate cyclase/YHS domain-containing protein
VASPSSTFLFADLSGFTALTEVHGDEDAVDLIDAFCAEVRALLPGHAAQEIKTMGDALMIRVPAAEEAVRLGLEIVNDVGQRHGFPMVRVGMHSGPAVERNGDWFGATVNLAARVSAAASGGEVLLTAVIRDEAGDLPGVEIHERGRQALKNLADPVDLFAAVAQGGESQEGLPIDPICRMAVDPAHSAGSLTHAGVEYHFCSLKCAGRFAASPERYT